MVVPGTSSTPPVMTLPGSPQTWVSTAVIMFDSRIGHVSPSRTACGRSVVDAVTQVREGFSESVRCLGTALEDALSWPLMEFLDRHL